MKNNLDSLFRNLKEELVNTFKFKEFYVLLYNEYNKRYFYPKNYPQNIWKMVVLFNDRYKNYNEKIIIKSKDILPDNIINDNERKTILIFPLYYVNNYFGLILFAYESNKIAYYNFIREHLSVSLDTIFMLSEIQEKSIELDKLNKDLEKKVLERTVDLNNLNKELKDKNNKYLDLLNYAEEGILIFSSSLKVENEHSRKCLDIFGEDIDDKEIYELLCNGSTESECTYRTFLKNIFEDIFKESNTKKRNVYLDLLPNTYVINNKIITAKYNFIDLYKEKKIMILLNDITYSKKLERMSKLKNILLKWLFGVFVI